jgi:hypothetical protein
VARWQGARSMRNKYTNRLTKRSLIEKEKKGKKQKDESEIARNQRKKKSKESDRYECN